ncbi:P-loop containing nucleoside triphosphate hydrolase protein [Mycena crocata]|nr:P-loop containing nucleoside triphosphate hydrolase protein [Mycena crocata]
MPKRPANVDSEDESSSYGTPASKRARITDSDDEHARHTKNKGKARRKDNEEDDVEGSEAENDASGTEEDRKFEEVYQDIIRDQLESRRKIYGGIADHGIIESIEMHQFMCHKYLTFSFGPQINFIIGHNGSGKSAVLSALTVALGAKATSTGRGSGLKAFIREGQTVAEVTISLKNQGEEAYKPKEYGKYIVITRRFTKQGSSSWKIKSKDGKLVSTKKDEVAAICDHMNIQVDNPMNVLTQDASRQFLGASAPKDKYKLFLRGTQLLQLSEEYDLCSANITATSKVLAQKQEAIPDLKTAFDEAHRRFEEATSAREQAEKVDQLKRELAWARVNAKQEEMEGKIREAARIARRRDKIRESVKDAEVRLEAADEAVTALEQEYDGLGNRENLQEMKNELSARIRQNKEQIQALNVDLKAIDTQVKVAKTAIEEYTAAIETEEMRLKRETESKRQESQTRLDGARANVAAAEASLNAIREAKQAAEAETRCLKDAGAALEKGRNDLRTLVSGCEDAIKDCVKADQNRYAAYGNDIKRVVERIEQTRWCGEKPLGPFGIHVTLQDNQWAKLLRLQLGSLLNSFGITDTRDLPVLRRILNEHKNDQIPVHIFRPELFDYSRGEPPADVLTVLRVLEISDPHVLRIMINKASIESRVLVQKRVDAGPILANLRGGVAWSRDEFVVTRYPYRRRRVVDPHQQPQTDTPHASCWKRQREQKDVHENALREADVALRAAQDNFNIARRERDALADRERDADRAVISASAVVRRLEEEANEDLPAKLVANKSALEDTRTEKDIHVKQFTAVSAQKAELDESNKKLVGQRDTLQAEIMEFASIKQAVQDKIDTAVGERTTLLKEVDYFKGKLEDEQTKVDAAEATVAVISDEFKEWTKRAEKYCERVETDRHPDVVSRSLEATQSALRERERQHGASVEETTAERKKAEERLDRAKSDLKQLTNLNKALKKSLIVRRARWQEFRRHIAVRCKLIFGYNLSQRGYFGKILFDHGEKTLKLKVKTDDQVATRGGRDKDPLSLSGGEKSFSTICLLLSLWDSIGCPLRCLDEFDVFMDAINRRISMRMLIDTAKQSDKKQFVLITPQDMGNVTIDPTVVKVLRMSDPERGQGVLEF